MKNSIAKIFARAADETVHLEFVKFGKGKFENRYLLEGKKQKAGWNVKSGSEFANFLVGYLLKNAPEKIFVQGAIISTIDMKKDISSEVENVKNYMGIKQFIINSEVEKNKIIELMKKYPRAFFALSFSCDAGVLKIKAKAPKSAKPGNKAKDDEGPKADFCSLKTSDREIINDLFFDFPNFNEIKISHTIEINEIEIPKNAKTPEEMREKAIRKGVIKRFVDVDGRKETKEVEFAA